MKKLILALMLFVSVSVFAEPISFFGIELGMSLTEVESILAELGAIKDNPQEGSYSILIKDSLTPAYTILPLFVSKRLSRLVVFFNTHTVSDIFIDMYGKPLVSSFDENGYPFFKWSDSQTEITLKNAEPGKISFAIFDLIIP